MSKNSGPNKDNLEQTHKLFLSEAKKEFVKYGYADASTNRIVDNTGMARGSLYYHFGDKKGLFTQVYKSLLLDMAAHIEKAMTKEKTHWGALKAGCGCYIDLCLKKERRRIILESYAALDYHERLNVQKETLLRTLEETVKNAQQEGYFKNQDPMVISILIYGMISEAGRSFELFKKPKDIHDSLRQTAMDTLDKMAQ
ncbi:MAG: TetR/AcrR family transcriptional regulator [Pseudomonadota bacterium]